MGFCQKFLPPPPIGRAQIPTKETPINPNKAILKITETTPNKAILINPHKAILINPHKAILKITETTPHKAILSKALPKIITLETVFIPNFTPLFRGEPFCLISLCSRFTLIPALSPKTITLSPKTITLSPKTLSPKTLSMKLSSDPSPPTSFHNVSFIASRSQLFAAFGPPNRPPSADNKVLYNWSFVSQAGDPFFVYDWKKSPSVSSNPLLMTQWNIGALSYEASLRALEDVLTCLRMDVTPPKP